MSFGWQLFFCSDPILSETVVMYLKRADWGLFYVDSDPSTGSRPF